MYHNYGVSLIFYSAGLSVLKQLMPKITFCLLKCSSVYMHFSKVQLLSNQDRMLSEDSLFLNLFPKLNYADGDNFVLHSTIFRPR